MVPGVSISILALLLLVLLAGGVIALLLRLTGRTGRWVAVPVVILLVLLFVILVKPSVQKQVHIQQFGNPSNTYTSPTADRPTPAIWASGLEDQLEADVYPSLRSAANALGRRLAKRLSHSVSEGKLAVSVQVGRTKEGDPLGMEVVNSVADGLRASGHLKDVMVMTSMLPAANASAREDTTVITISLSVSESAPEDAASKGGAISADVSGASGGLIETVEYVDKPWVENFAAFVSSKPQGRWILARSQDSCTSAELARQQALDDTGAALGFYDSKIARLWRLGQAHPHAADIQASELIADRFVQSFAGTAGSIWREAVLVEVSPEKLAQFQHVHVAKLTKYRRTWLGRIVSLAGILALICVVYLFLNAATKGYYTWALRITTAVLIVAMLLATMALIA